MGLITPEQADDLMKALDRTREWDHNQMPDEATALKVFFKAYQRLKDFGWRDIIYAPKDDTVFEIIEPGSTGIFKCHYQEKPARGSFWTPDDGGSPSHPVLFRRTTCFCGMYPWPPGTQDLVTDTGIVHRAWACSPPFKMPDFEQPPVSSGSAGNE